jgi:hypothetical protein
MTGESLPYILDIYVNEAMLALQGGIQLAGNNAVMMRFTGTLLMWLVTTVSSLFKTSIQPMLGLPKR